MKSFRAIIWILMAFGVFGTTFEFTGIPLSAGLMMLTFTPLLMGGLWFIRKWAGWEND